MDLDTLKKFCDTGNSCIDAPFSIGDHTYATDGYMAIRVPLLDGAEGALKGASKRPTYIVDIFASSKSIIASEAWTAIDAIEKDQEIIKCDECQGTGKLYECPECEGNGEVHWTSESGNDYSDECAVCNGSGKLSATKNAGRTCDNCNGTGHTYEDTSITLNGKCFTSRLINKINLLPSAEIYLDFNNPEATKVDFSCSLPAVPFRFEGGEGIIMQRLPS